MHLKVYSNTGEIVFVDFVYDIAINTLFASKEASCDKSMDNLFDSTLYSRINAELHRSFNCTVPFLPEYGINSAGETTYICMEPKKSAEAFRLYDYLRSSGQSSICGTPCEGMDVYLGLPFISKTGEQWAHIKIYLKLKMI